MHPIQSRRGAQRPAPAPPARARRQPLHCFATALAVILAVIEVRPLLAPRASAAPSDPGAERQSSHWAFQPLSSPPVPAVRNRAWSRTAIDRFILAAMEARGLHPAPPADPRTLLRRAAFDLTGLPPAPEVVEAFVSDTAPDAFARYLEPLLAAPAHGERWGRHWLDVARYADNKGYVFFEEKTYPWAWTYRDYVIRAFNQDKPFDRFVVEQLAADQIDLGGDRWALTATGFLTAGDHFSNNTHDILDDRIDVVTRGLLGLTVSCARCHDHKFDPVTQADYYALYGILRSASEPMVPPALETLSASEPSEGFEIELIARQGRLRDYVESKHREIVDGARKRIGEYLMAAFEQRDQPSTEAFMLIADKGDLNPGVIARWRAFLDRTGSGGPAWGPWHALAQLDPARFPQDAPTTLAALARTGAIHPRVLAALSARPMQSMRDAADAYAAMLHAVDDLWQRSLIAARTAGQPAPERLPDLADEDLRRALYGPAAPPDVPAQLDWGFLSLLPDRASQGEFQKLLKDLEQWLMTAPAAPARAMALRDLPAPYDPHVFVRGNPNRPGARVPRRFPSALDPTERPFTRGGGRRDLADAIVREHPALAARVFVNRVWAHHFGAGLVATPSDFGTRGEPPTHPELLEWLASEFIRSGWSVKHLHRIIMNSATYQQSSSPPSAAQPQSAPRAGSFAQLDPENRWLTRMNRRRHDYETQRDALLSVSGRLDPRRGGPASDLESARRSVYTFVNRMDIPPVMTTFDFPSPSSSCPQRGFTTSAPQALYLMNHPFTDACAQSLLQRPEIDRCGSPAERIDRLHRLLFSRPATEWELRLALDFLGASPREPVWRRYTQALLMANEFVFVD